MIIGSFKLRDKIKQNKTNNKKSKKKNQRKRQYTYQNKTKRQTTTNKIKKIKYVDQFNIIQNLNIQSRANTHKLVEMKF